ncbi:MAG: histone deacetylase family protein [Gammaproteobacteria bacterium]|jgi:acetoin utilization deacetylase AcuC-like enzyme|nr:histone deacetylase family protein [Gammaproteobacteria bacterium]
MTIALVSHPDCAAHEMGVYHPERPERLSAINDRLIASGLDILLHHYDAPRATREQLERAHAGTYIDEIFAASPTVGHVWLDGDTSMNPHTLEAALRAAGAVVLGVDLVMQGQIRQGFCNVRPPGHHAERARAMGFCLFNNIAVGAYHAIQQHRLDRVAIVDFDVHHGNGTEDLVSGDERILLCSSFQHPFYPHTGFDSEAPNVVNVPLASGTDGEMFREALTAAWLPRLAEFAPQLVLISAGFDGHRAEDMAHLNLLEFDYAWITRKLLEIARESAGGRIVSSLEGGYELHALARSVEAHIRVFLGG